MKFKDTIQDILVEQSWWNSVKDSLISAVSPITASAVLLKNAIKLYRGNGIKRVRLIFPQQNWEMNAVNFLKKFGVVTGVYETLDDARTYVQSLAKNGVKADEFVIGSHGKAGTLLANRSFSSIIGSYSFDNSFLTDFKPILKPSTTVFFTACNGADFLETLKDAADTLGVGVYGSSGIYNYVTNSSQNGFYYCSAGEYKKPTTGKIIQPFVINKLKEIDFNIESHIKSQEDGESELTYNILVKGGAIDIPKFKNLISKDKVIEATSHRYGDKTKSSTKTLYNKDFNNAYETYQLVPIHEIMLSLPSFSDMDDYTKVYRSLAKAFDNGQITVNIHSVNGTVPLQSFKPFDEPGDEVDNKFLLSSGMCKKVGGSPVSWL